MLIISLRFDKKYVASVTAMDNYILGRNNYPVSANLPDCMPTGQMTAYPSTYRLHTICLPVDCYLSAYPPAYPSAYPSAYPPAYLSTLQPNPTNQTLSTKPYLPTPTYQTLPTKPYLYLPVCIGEHLTLFVSGTRKSY